MEDIGVVGPIIKCCGEPAKTLQDTEVAVSCLALIKDQCHSPIIPTKVTRFLPLLQTALSLIVESSYINSALESGHFAVALPPDLATAFNPSGRYLLVKASTKCRYLVHSSSKQISVSIINSRCKLLHQSSHLWRRASLSGINPGQGEL